MSKQVYNFIVALIAIGRFAARHMHALLKVDDFNAASGTE